MMSKRKRRLRNIYITAIMVFVLLIVGTVGACEYGSISVSNAIYQVAVLFMGLLFCYKMVVPARRCRDDSKR